MGGLKKSKDGTKLLHNLVALSHSVIFKSASRLSPDQQVGAAALSPPQGVSPGISNYFYQAYILRQEKRAIVVLIKGGIEKTVRWEDRRMG